MGREKNDAELMLRVRRNNEEEKNGAHVLLRVRRNKKRGEEWRTRVAKGKTKQDEYREE